VAEGVEAIPDRCLVVDLDDLAGTAGEVIEAAGRRDEEVDRAVDAGGEGGALGGEGIEDANPSSQR
jgi:hypothetical protein